MAVRAKIRCHAKTVTEGRSEVHFHTVYEPDGTKNDENARFTKATPWGDIRLGIDNPVALEQFEVNGYLRASTSMNAYVAGRVDTSHPNGCWVWTLATFRNGYGQATYGGKKFYAHRLSWVLHNGPIPEGLCVLHHCDNRPCVNPSHLFLGTKKENTHDAQRKGRLKSPGARGQRNAKAKLTEDDVRLILAEGILKKMAIGDMARKYEVTPALIRMILRRRIWKHVDFHPAS